MLLLLPGAAVAHAPLRGPHDHTSCVCDTQPRERSRDLAAVAPVLAHRPFRWRAFARVATHLKTSAATPGQAMAESSEAIRLRLAAALLDLGNHLMLPAEERKAFRLRRRLYSARARRLGLVGAAVRAGARRLDDVMLEIAIGERVQECNPKRTLALSCVVYERLDPDDGTEEASSPFFLMISTARGLTHGGFWPVGPWKWPEVCITYGLWRATIGFDRRATRH
jgi:hypothetical protein